ncbi:MAG: HTH-type transcriptional regulator CysB [Candidatus Sedimenticola sp. (ex Thyasira tokunagai)]
MKLQQLKFLLAVVQNDLNITAASEHLFTSQPGVSKQIKLLERELGVQIFERAGRHLTSITPAGKTIIQRAEAALREIDSIRDTAREFSNPGRGSLSIATTHTQARYVLPQVIHRFRQHYPQVNLQMHQGNPEQISEMAATGAVDFAIATKATAEHGKLITMPCYQWNRVIITPCDHPLRHSDPLTLKAIANHPIVTYVFGFPVRSQLDTSFHEQGLEPNVVFTATDADVIKTYVELGLGVGILARMAYDKEKDKTLCALDARHLFPASTTRLGFRPGIFLRSFHYDFIELFASHLTREVVDTAVAATSEQDREWLFRSMALPTL